MKLHKVLYSKERYARFYITNTATDMIQISVTLLLCGLRLDTSDLCNFRSTCVMVVCKFGTIFKNHSRVLMNSTLENRVEYSIKLCSTENASSFVHFSPMGEGDNFRLTNRCNTEKAFCISVPGVVARWSCICYWRLK